MSFGDQTKWFLPGWRIEQRYAPGVLIGNWSEERYEFQKGRQQHNSTHRTDFKHNDTHRPDVVLRRKAQIQNDGLGQDFLFCHHGNRYSNNMISWYDEHYNKRERDDKNRLPELRQWDSHQLAWVPEKSDYPIQGDPTNFGLHRKLQSKWHDQVADETHGDYNTLHRINYTPLPVDSMVCQRYATPRAHSTSLHRFNAVNKNLNLRGAPMLQSPESLPTVPRAQTAPSSERIVPCSVY